MSYAAGYSRGDTFEQYGTNGVSLNGVQTQVLGNLHMDRNWQPAEQDRLHILTLSGRTELPGGITLSPIFRYMSENPFTIYHSQFDLDRNGTNWDPLPAGSYSGVGNNPVTVEHNGRQGGARAADFINLDLRFGWRARPAEGDTLDIYFDIINLFNRPNFNNPVGNQNSSNFMNYTSLRSGGIPRQANFGVRYGFQEPRPEADRSHLEPGARKGRPASLLYGKFRAVRPCPGEPRCTSIRASSVYAA